MRLSIIVAASDNNVIGNQGDLPWRLSADLKRFKSLTMGHAIIMGRKTYESINRLLPGRTTVVLTRQTKYCVDGAIVAQSLESALKSLDQDDESFIIGGEEIYRVGLSLAQRIYLTRVHCSVKGDAYLPEIDWDEWKLVEQTEHGVDERNQFSSTFQIFDRQVNS